ncbi:NAD(P)H-binding protein [Candidatus Sodalis endolongispinus]|uniref:NAD(P)H-binding protein n=1 Tax=Candidatus Sodalis endolongispinus TaxID=2812662 RepID=A0ABS5YEM8_9GAMM|nr:NAD(P)H-binding protein [Candidatus Sodalis endolongispinus]MBT9433408.1 NAD(P)H-binding protein [Candidatus Sodalis endolongispinus]
MSKILILGAAAKIAQHAIAQFIAQKQDDLTLYLRNARLLQAQAGKHVRVIDGDVMDTRHLQQVAQGQDVVYANLAGDNIKEQSLSTVTALEAVGVRRLIWISTLGIYDEVPGAFGKWNHEMLDGGYLEPYSAAASVIASSKLDTTILRPAWLTDKGEVDYELTQKGEPFKGTEVSRKSVADLVVKLARDPKRHVYDSLGVNKPGTDGDKPSWY